MVGDEIGMGEDLRVKERDAVRTPMQWSDETHGGFTTAEKPVKPPLAEGPYGYAHVQEVKLSLAGVEGGDRMSNLMVNDDLEADASGTHRIALEAFGYKWYRVGGLGYALKARRDSGAGVAW